jgi:hypothetical protein
MDRPSLENAFRLWKVYCDEILGVRPMDLLPYPQRSERDSIAADAKHVVGMSPEERAAVFVGLERTMEAILAHLPPEDRRRRREASRLLDPRPTPWWKNLRRSAWPHDDAAP